jgi:hypothetical protein
MPPKIIYANEQMTNYQTYNRNSLFTIEPYGLVNMMFIEFTIKAKVGSITFPAPTSPYLIKDVSLESFGSSFSRVTTSYTLGRMDEEDSDLYSQIISGATCIGANLSGPQKVTLPLYFYVIDRQKLDARKYKNLQVRLTTKDTVLDMGFSGGDVEILDVRLKIMYDDPKLYTEISLKNSYNVYRVTEIIDAGALENVVSIKLNNPFVISNIYFMIRKNTTASIKGLIKSIKLTYPNNEIGIYDNQSNYYLNKTNSANFGNTFAIQLASRYKREQDYFQPTGQNAPLIAEITYTVTITGDYKLFIASEYYSNIVESDGMLLEDINGSYIRF